MIYDLPFLPDQAAQDGAVSPTDLRASGSELPRDYLQPHHSSAGIQKRGRYWIIRFGDRVVGLRSSKGIEDIAFLLAHPGLPVPATALKAGPKALGSIQNQTLQRSFEAESRHPQIRIPDPHKERARVAVTKRIRVALQEMSWVHPELGHHLTRTIRPGTICQYDPPPTERYHWLRTEQHQGSIALEAQALLDFPLIAERALGPLDTTERTKTRASTEPSPAESLRRGSVRPTPSNLVR
jgi:hypothetical protein